MVDLELDDGLAVITIDRPHARNAISLETMDQFDKALDGARAPPRSSSPAPVIARSCPGATSRNSARCAPRTRPAMAWRMRSICDRIAGFPGADRGGAERACARRRRRGRGGSRHPARRRRHQDRLQPGDAGDHARMGRRRAARRAGRVQQGTPARRHRDDPRRAEAERSGLVDQVFPRDSFDDRMARDRAGRWRTAPPARSSASCAVCPPPKRSPPLRGCGWPTSTGPRPTR